MRQKQKRITCPICMKRIIDIKINGDAALETKCIHCGNIIEVIYDNNSQPKITKRVIGMNTS